MPHSREFKEMVRDRAERDPAYRLAMLTEALDALHHGDHYTARILLRDYINATIGFAGLARATERHPKTLMRMFGPKGNPNLDALAAVLKVVVGNEGYEVWLEPAGRGRTLNEGGHRWKTTRSGSRRSITRRSSTRRCNG
jgi:DNA-binding phage protein